MSALLDDVEWYDELVVVDAERLERHYDAVASYAKSVRDMWADSGEDVTTPESQEAFRLVAYSMLVPERETWMPLGRALYVRLGVALKYAVGETPEPAEMKDDRALDFRDALRTLNAATELEMDWAVACHVGVDTDVVTTRYRGRTDDDADMRTGRTSLYRHYDVDGRLLYVGIAADPHKRHEQHQRSSRWARLSNSMTVQWFATRSEADIAEREAISSERPVFNTTHAGREAKERAIDYLLGRLA